LRRRVLRLMRRALPFLLALLAAVPLLASPAGAAGHPGVLDRMGSATRVIIVTTPSWRATSGGATLWQKSGTTWRAVRAGIPVRVGRSGFQTANARHEGDGTTPAGKFPMRFAFGSRPNPGVHVGWKSLAPRTCWSGERRDYNTWVRRTCTGRDEDLWAARAVAYRYAAVVGFNDNPAVWGRGSGIFLHETLNRPTAGCVAMSQANLLWTLRWMTPGAWIVMGPQAYVDRL
jgi:L,D-peptidoglycan transpeptidase YkuD (ErfK/YbiS/YcfS/YnhG family)